MNNEINKISNLIRLTDERVDNLNREKSNWGNVIYVSDTMIKFQKYLLLIVVLFGFLFGGFSNINNLLVGMLKGACYGFFGALIPVVFSYLYYGIVKIISNQKIKKLDMDITTYKVLRKFYDNELTKVKNNELGFEPMETIEIDYDKEYNKLISNEPRKNNSVTKTKKLVLKKR